MTYKEVHEMYSADHRTMYAADDRDGSTKRIDIRLITELTELKNGARPRKRKP